MDPISVGALAIGAISSIFGNSAKKKAARAAKRAALEALREARRDITLRELQETQLASQSMWKVERDYKMAAGLVRASAGEAGVAGVSVDALAGDLAGEMGRFKTTTEINLDMALESLQREKKKEEIVAAQRIAQAKASEPNAFMTALQIVGQGFDFLGARTAASPLSASASVRSTGTAGATTSRTRGPNLD
jgi:hypothetical protein